MSQSPSSYRPDIDGLRAVAVTAVVCFHAGVPGVGGGYAGVDVFFVISGFLIISIILRDLRRGAFSLVEFYERRARRILPALFAVFAATAIAGIFLLMPWDLADLGKSMKYALVSTSNIYFNRTTGDYFDGDAELMPLLHTWSLGVEEQFYLCTPLLMMLVWRGRRPAARLWGLLGGITVLSLAGAAWMVHKDKGSSFYLLPYRAWELAIGGMVAMLRPPALRPAARHLLGIAGLGMIVATLLSYTPETLFPGLSAVLPCAGTALVIISGIGAPGMASRLLSLRPIVFTGLISYSVYLWHWPMLAFYRHAQERGKEWPAWTLAVIVGLSFLLGWLSWKFVETPFRKKAAFTRRWIFRASAAGTLVLLGVAFLYSKTELFYNLLPAEAKRLAEYRNSANPLQTRGKDLPVSDPDVYGEKSVKPSMALWGDSHAGALIYPLHEMALKHHTAFCYFGRSGTTPLPLSLLKESASYADSGDAYTEAVLQRLLGDTSLRTVILASRWAYYMEGPTGAYGPAEGRKTWDRGKAILPDEMYSSPALRQAFPEILHALVGRLLQAGKTVAVVYPVPEPAWRVPQTLADEVLRGADPHDFRIPAEKVFFERQRYVLQGLDSLPDAPNFFRIKPHELLIRDGIIRLMESGDGHVLYRDDDHLSNEGGRMIMPLFEPLFLKHTIPAGTVTRSP